MNKFTTYGHILKRSFTSLQYYNDVINAPLSLSIKFYLITFFLFALFGTLFYTIRVYIPLHGSLERLPDHIINAYPNELIISINRGQVTTNVDEPYFIPLSVLDPITQDFEKSLLGVQENTPINLLVIDTAATSDLMRSYKTWSLLSWNTFSYINDSGNIETVSLDDINNVQIDKTGLVTLLNHIEPFFKAITPFLIVSTFIGFLFWGISLLFYLLFIAIIYSIIGKLTKHTLTFKQAYQLSLHLIFIPIFVFTFAGFMGFDTWFPFRNMIVLTILGAIVIQKLNTKQQKTTRTPSWV